jgi:hypothetical protein
MDRIETYRADLADLLRLAPSAADRLLDETEAHLRDAVDAEQARGLSADAAEQQALERFGSATDVARSANGGVLGLLGRLAFGGAQLAVAGCVAVFAGTMLAELLGRVTSLNWVFGLPGQITPAASQIAHWIQVQPQAHGWRPAAALENADDSLLLRSGFALVVAVGALVFLRLGQHRLGRLAGPAVPALGFAAFAGAAVVLLVSGIVGRSLVELDWGRGQWFSDGAVAVLAAAVCAVRWRRDVRAA